MAYAFSAIDELLKGEQQQQGQTNIFGGAAAPNPMEQQNLSGGQAKTVAESGSADAANPSAVGGSSTPTSSLDDVRLGTKAAYAANMGKTQQPKALGDVQSQLKSNQQRLQKEADDYTKSQQANQSYNLGSDVLGNAISKGPKDASWNSVSDLLGRASAKPVDEFKPSDVEVNDLNMFGSNAGLKNLVSRGMGPSYTGGMAAFDVRALQKSPGFNDSVRNLYTSRDALRKQAGELGGTLRTQAEEYGAKALGEAQKSARGYLDKRSGDLSAANAAEAAAYNKALAGIDLKKAAADAEAAALTSAQADVTQMNPLALRFFDQGAVNEADYIKRGADRTAADFVSEAEAGQYNNILSLLGAGGQTWAQSQAVPDAAKNYSVDSAGMQKALTDQALAGFGKYKVKTQGDIDALRNTAQARADAEEAAYLALVQDQGKAPWLNTEAQNAYQAAGLADKYGAYADVSKLIDINKYSAKDTAAPDIGWSNVLSQTEADKMNEYARSIGANDMYQAGTYKREDPYGFSKDSYLTDLIKALEGRKTGSATHKLSSPVRRPVLGTTDLSAGYNDDVYIDLGKDPATLPRVPLMPTYRAPSRSALGTVDLLGGNE